MPIQRFARFFRLHGLAIGLLVSFLPIGTTALGLLPYFGSIKTVTAFTVTLTSVLLISVLFGTRRQIATYVFPSNRILTPQQLLTQGALLVGVPVILALLSLFSACVYLMLVEDGVDQVAVHAALEPGSADHSVQPESEDVTLWQYLRTHDRGVGRLFGDSAPEMKIYAEAYTTTSSTGANRTTSLTYLTDKARSAILEKTPANQVPGWLTQGFFFGLMFTAASGCLVWSGLIDYLQTEAGITDEELLTNPYRTRQPAERVTFRGGVQAGNNGESLYFTRHEDDKGTTFLSGPYCVEHDKLLRYLGPSSGSRKNYQWTCGSKHQMALAYNADGMASFRIDNA